MLNLSDLNVKYSNLDNYVSPNKGTQPFVKGAERSRMNTIEPSSTDFGQTGSQTLNQGENSMDSPKKMAPSTEMGGGKYDS